MGGIFYSGQKAVSTGANIIDEKFYYKGSILIGAGAAASLKIHNCSSTGTPSAANMVAELSVPAVAGECAVDNLHGAIECPDGITYVLSGASAVCHIRGCATPF